MPDCFLPAGSDAPAVPVTAVTRNGLPAVAAALPEAEAAWIAASRFEADAGEHLVLPGADGGLARVLHGLGDGAGADGLGAGRLPEVLPPGTYALGDGFADRGLAAVAWGLGAYRFARYRDDKRGPCRLVLPQGADAAMAETVITGAYLARDLINTPANDLGPAELAGAAEELAGRHGASYAEVVGEALIAARFPLVHAVGAAAADSRAPRLVDLTWGDAGAPKVTLVGKGVCFDSGGLDIKPASGMAIMKKDMGGAANVLGLAAMVMDAGLGLRLRVLIPAVENAIGPAAFRPGDVFASRKGLTVEIGNTDAEGRLVLADALALACEEAPDLVIDLATLTGAARVALGPEVVPFYTGNDDLAAAVAGHAARVADPLWRMPLWRNYMAMLDSRVADINNAGASPFAGSVTAALFLSRFVTKDTDWLHGDIYGWNPTARPGRPVGGEAQAIRALFAWLSERYPA